MSANSYQKEIHSMMTQKRRFVAALSLGLALFALVIIVLPTRAAPSGARPSSPPAQGSSPCGDNFQINVFPSFPTRSNMINITYSAVWDSLPTPQPQSHHVIGNMIRFNAIYYLPEETSPPETSWGDSANVGILPTGTYTVRVYLATSIPPVTFPYELCGTGSFKVYDELYQAFLPVVGR